MRRALRLLAQVHRVRRVGYDLLDSERADQAVRFSHSPGRFLSALKSAMG
jgi:hypothetical protein